MGYRSDVVIAFYSTRDKQIPFAKLWLKENLPQHKSLKDCFTELNAGYLFEVEGVKWYEDYEDVKQVLKFMEDFIEMFCRDDDPDAYGACEFVRVGEELEDIEVTTYGHHCAYLLSVCRHIDTENLVGVLGEKS